MRHTDLVRDTLRALGLPASQEGLEKAHRITRSADASRMRVEEGEWEGCLDRERIEREILPAVLEANPGLDPLLQSLGEWDEGIHTVCHTLDWFLEKVHLLAGNRPLPSHHGVHVKNFDAKEPRFGFLVWREGEYIIQIKKAGGLEELGQFGVESESYPTAFDAAIHGWLVD